MNQTTRPNTEQLSIPVDEGIELRLLSRKNADELYEVVKANQEHLRPWVFWAGDGFSRDVLLEMLEKNEKGYREGSAYAMGIYERGNLAGSTDIRGIGSEEGAEVGYWLAKDATGRGLATKATSALISYSRSHHDISRIVLHTMVENEPSSRVAERLGFKFEKIVPNQEHGIEEKRYVRNYEQAN